MSSVTDLIYAGEHQKEVEADILKMWPNAIIEDASDEIHRGRFQLTIPDERENRYLIWAGANGLFDMSFDISLGLNMDETRERYIKLMNASVRLVKARQENDDE